MASYHGDNAAVYRPRWWSSQVPVKLALRGFQSVQFVQKPLARKFVELLRFSERLKECFGEAGFLAAHLLLGDPVLLLPNVLGADSHSRLSVAHTSDTYSAFNESSSVCRMA